MEVKTKILIVDDEPINLDFFDVMLSRLGFEVLRAEDGEEALASVEESHPDLIILDNVMPKMSGWTVTRLLKKDKRYKEFRDIPVIMFSAMDDVKDKIEGYELGVEDYILKPFNFSEVLARIRAVLRGRALAKQVVRKERRLAAVNSLNKSLVYFTQHLKQPVLDLQKAGESLDVSNAEDVHKFLDLVKVETEETLATLSALEDEIQDLQTLEDSPVFDDSLLEDLEKKFQEHFSNWKEKADS